MPDLGASDVTVTLVPQDVEFLGMGLRMSLPTINFGNGSKTYPANGVPLPSIGNFGMKKAIKRVMIQGPPGTGYVYKYDPTNHTVRIYQGAGLTPAGSVSAVSAGTPAGTVAAPVFTGDALATHNHDLKVMGGASGGIDEAIGVEGTDTLAKDAATDRTIAGADSATKGGVVGTGAGTPAGTCSAPAFTGSALATHTHTLTGDAVAAAPLAELGNVAVAATQLELTIIGQ